jgi:uncharacterized glyoxalase superfamily protein PhnB
MTPTNVTPLYVVERIEPALPFWRSLGWTKDVEVLHEGRLGFVILSNGGRSIMLQTRESLAEDLPAVRAIGSASALYVDVPSIAEAVAACKGARVLIRDRTTFYGARETWVVDPAGVVVGFAEHEKPVA